MPAEYDNYVFLSSLYNGMASMLGDGKYSEKAADIARKGIAVEEFGPAIRVQYARALSALGDDETAIKELEFAIKLDPNFGQPVALLGQIYQHQGKYDEALKMLRDFAASHAPDADVEDAIKSIEASAQAQ